MRILLLFAALVAASCGFRIEPPALPLVVDLQGNQSGVFQPLDVIN